MGVRGTTVEPRQKHFTEDRAEERRAGVRDRLEWIYEWYGRMVSEQTGRLIYLYDPETGRIVADGSPIRDIASVWSLELLSRFLGRRELIPVAERTLEYYGRMLRRRDGDLILDPLRLGEASSIAHSAFLLLALLHSDLQGRQAMIAGLAEGLVHQQRRDGSLKVYFGIEPDDGLEFYPGEALLALLETYEATREARYLESAIRGADWCRSYYEAGRVTPDLIVFFANWQSQYSERLHRHVGDEALKREVREYVFGLHDRIVREGFYQHVAESPHAQATVEVACALEGINAAYAIAARDGDSTRMARYAEAIRVALAYLFRAQCVLNCAEREQGGFGLSLTDRLQRIDVTGHVANGLMAVVRNGLAR